jgi:uncharacterized protein YejL (UPF0352 family)
MQEELKLELVLLVLGHYITNVLNENVYKFLGTGA